MNELDRRLYRTLYRKSFYEFYKAFWSTCDPSKYTDGDIIQFFCEVFQFMCRKWIGYDKPEVDLSSLNKNAVIVDIRNEDKDRLCLNMPPRHSKSKIFNVMGPSWLWAQYPIKAVSISHTFDLAKTMNEGRWSIINSDLYKTLYPEIKTIANTKDSIVDSRGGQLFSQNRNAMTGYGGDIIINDDLTNAMTAYKDMTEMSNAWEYYRNTMPSRINDVNKSVIFNIQQRLGVNDITGHILRDKALRDRYIFIVLPAIFEKETYLICPISGKIIHYNKGDGLWKERFGNYAGIRAEVGESIFRTQYLQDPQATDQAIIDQPMLNILPSPEVPPIEEATLIYASHDFPIKDKETSDYLGSVLAYKVDNTLYIIDCLEKHMAFPQSISYVESLDNIYPSIIQVIEDKANGSPILQQLQGKISGLQAYNPGTASKTMRLESASMYMNNIVFVADEFDKLNQEWSLSDNLQNLINRLLSFPMVEHDDIVDAFSMLVNFVFLDRKYAVYGRSFNDKNVINYRDISGLYSANFVNKDGDTWWVNKISIEYAAESRLIVSKELKFKANIDDAIKKLKEFDNSNMFIDCSIDGELTGFYSNDVYFERYTIEDFDQSIIDLNLAFSRKVILLFKNCRMTKGDIETFKFAKTKTDESKYLTDKDGFVANIRVAMKYFGGII